MKIGYFGTPEMSANLLKALIQDKSHKIVFIVSNPDKPRGRSGKSLPSVVAQVALQYEIPLFRFPNLSETEIQKTLKSFSADLFLVFAYGKILPRNIFEIPEENTINLHASILPALRGASPIQSAIINGHQETGWTLQYITEKLDAGKIIATAKVPIHPEENCLQLNDKMVPIGIQLTMEVLGDLKNYKTKAISQDHNKATYCSRLSVEHSWIHWKRNPPEIHAFVRGLYLWPVARTYLDNKVLKIYKTSMLKKSVICDDIYDLENQLKEKRDGSVMALSAYKNKRLIVKAGGDLLEILEIQLENRKRMSAREFLNGYRLQPGARFH